MTAFPSAIQRSDTLVGMATPTSAPLLSDPEALSPPRPPEHAASATATPRAAAASATFLNFTVIPFER